MSLVSGTRYTTEITSRKNIIINGNMDVWQRGTSFAAAASSTVSADRFKYIKVGTMVHTLSQSTDVPTYAESGIKSNYSTLLDVTTTDTSIDTTDYCTLSYRVEGYDYSVLAGGNASLSFWVKAAKTGIHCVAFRNSGNDRSYIAEYTVDVADTWQKVTITIPLTETGGTWDYTTGKGLEIMFMLAVGPTYQTTADVWQTGNFLGTSNQVNETDNTANNFRIAQVQLEAGIVATDFEKRHYADELVLCKRYFERYERDTDGDIYLAAGGGHCVSTTVARHHVEYAVEKRGVPTITTNALLTTQANGTGVSVTSIAIAGISRRNARFACTATGLVQGDASVLALSVTGYVTIDAEL